MVRDGSAWRYVQYDKPGEFTAAESDAREHRRGLWADPHPMAPWEWRKAKRPAAKTRRVRRFAESRPTPRSRSADQGQAMSGNDSQDRQYAAPEVWHLTQGEVESPLGMKLQAGSNPVGLAFESRRSQ